MSANVARASAPEIRTSVVIPVYNTAEFLPACLDSVLGQTQREIEVIIVDDGSTDACPAIERDYASRDERVRVVSQPNRRQGAARNLGLELARGAYVFFMDSDDVIEPTMFEVCYRACEERELDFAVFDATGFVDDPSVDRSDLSPWMKDRTGILPVDVMDGPRFWEELSELHVPLVCWLQYCRRDYLVKQGLRFAEGVYFEDNEWVARLYLEAKRVQYLPLKLYRYRMRADSVVHAPFSVAHAESCLCVYDSLSELLVQQKTPERFHVAEDIAYVCSHRFAQLAELPPEERPVKRALAFSDKLRSLCVDDNVSALVRRVHLVALVHLERGLSAWDGCARPVPREYFEELLLADMPQGPSVHRVGVYGTGKACSVLLRIWDTSNKDIVFLGTDPEPGATYAGLPLRSVRDIPELGLDVVVITSRKYQHEMKAEVRTWGGNVPVYVLPRYILALNSLGVL